MEFNKDWKENIDKYELIESLVKDSFFNQLKSLKINEKFWSYPYFNTTFSNGEKFADGNPMFSVFDKRQNKIIKVIIEESCGNFDY